MRHHRTFLECGAERSLCECVFMRKILCVAGPWQEPPSPYWEQAARWQRHEPRASLNRLPAVFCHPDLALW